jgi:hypothetical protein
VSDEKALDDSLADYTDKLLSHSADDSVPPEIAEEAQLAASLQGLIAPKGKPSVQMRQQLALRLASAYDAHEREKFRRSRLPFFRRYPLATSAAAVLVLILGIVLVNLDNLSAEGEVATGAGAIDVVTVAFFVILAVLGLVAAFFLERRK